MPNSEENNDIEFIKKELFFTGILVMIGKSKGSKLDFWKECGFNPSRGTDLYDNKNMQLFTNKTAENIITTIPPISQSTVSVRHKEINDVLERIIAHPQSPIKQVVILGSGFDVRATTYENSSVSFFEVDHPIVLSTKEVILNKNKIDKNATYIGIDYVKDDLISHLTQKG